MVYAVAGLNRRLGSVLCTSLRIQSHSCHGSCAYVFSGLNLVNGVKLVGVDTLEEALETAFEWPAQDLAFLSGE